MIGGIDWLAVAFYIVAGVCVVLACYAISRSLE